MNKTILYLIACFFSLAPALLADPVAFGREHPEPRVIGRVLLMRHAIAPGLGDPEYFDVKIRKTQRNLSEEGREQARAAGSILREEGYREVEVFSSQWFRCQDTASLLGYDGFTELEFLNSFFSYPENRERQTEATLQWLSAHDFKTPIILVTHQVNISALTGIVPASGEILIMDFLDDQTFQLVDKITPLSR